MGVFLPHCNELVVLETERFCKAQWLLRIYNLRLLMHIFSN